MRTLDIDDPPKAVLSVVGNKVEKRNWISPAKLRFHYIPDGSEWNFHIQNDVLEFSLGE